MTAYVLACEQLVVVLRGKSARLRQGLARFQMGVPHIAHGGKLHPRDLLHYFQ